jgi:replicative DNA helicase
MTPQRFDIAEAYKWWDVLRDGNQLTEIRLIANDGRTASGIFDNIDEIVKAVAPYTNDWNLYYTINRLPDDVRGLPQYNKIIVRPKQTCNDNMMVARDYVCIDLDSRRLAGTNATDEQVEFTKKKANEVYQYLVNVGFNPPTVVFSSNGVHLYLRCAMLNNEKNTKLVKRFLQALSMMFTDEHTDVDEKVFNCARIMRLPSTYSCKGNTMDASRPQRLCKFVKINENKVNDVAYFEKVAALYPEEEARPSSQNNYSMESFDLDAFIEKHNIPVTKKVEVADGTRYYLEHCLFNDQHKGKDAILFKHKNGAVAYFCYHNSCSGNDWRKVREMYEPDCYTRKSTIQPHRSFRPIRQEIVPKELQETEESKGNVWQCLSEIEDEDRSKIVSIPSGIIQFDKECCGFDKPSLSVWSGNNGSAKSTLLNQIALNAVNQGFKVAIYSGELRGKKMKRWLLYQAAGKQYNKKSTYNEYDYYTPTLVKDKIVEWLEGKLYNYNTRYSHNIEQVCLEVEKLVKEQQIDMLIMDNLSCLDTEELDGGVNEQQKAAIKMLLRLTEKLEIATQLVVHPRKSEAYLRKNDISGAKTLTDLADNVFFAHRWNQDTQKAAKEFLVDSVYYDLCDSGTTNVVEVIKMREFGEAEGHIYKLYFEPESRRLKNSIAEHIHYGWEDPTTEAPLPTTEDEFANNDFESSPFGNDDEDLPW